MIKQFILHRKITLFVLIILIGFGVYNYLISPRQETPEINAPVAMMTIIYPGASSEDIEGLVVTPIEDAIRSLSGYDYSFSYSQEDVGLVILRLSYDSDIDSQWQELRVILDKVEDQFPDGCQPVQLRTDLADTAGIMVTLTGQDLEEHAKQLIRKLNRLEGVSNFNLFGIADKALMVDFDLEKFNHLPISLDDSVQWLKSENVDLPLGQIGYQDQVMEVGIRGGLSSIEDVENLFLTYDQANGQAIYLKDFADISLDQVPGKRVRYKGQEALLLVGYFKKGVNIVRVGQEVTGELESYQDQVADVQINLVLNQPQTVDEAIQSFVINLMQGVLFVILVVLIGMGLRNAIIVSTAIPSAILITIGMMFVMNIELHQISIAALIVALGMLVDNAIVVSDAIQVRLDQDEDRLWACINGVKEVAIPVLTSTLTTIAAFLPLLLLNSIAGEYIISLPQIVMIALVISYIIAVSVTPAMAFIFFRKSKVGRGKHRIRGLVSRMVGATMKLKGWILLVLLMVLSSTVYLGLRLGLQFFPYAETDMFYIDVKEEDLDKAMLVLEEFLSEQAYIEHYTVALGDGLPKFYQTMSIQAPSRDVGQAMVVVDLESMKKQGGYETIVAYVQDLQLNFDKYHPDLEVNFKALEQGEPIGAPVVVRLTGQSQEELDAYCKEIIPLLQAIEGTTNVRSDLVSYKDRIDLVVRQDQLDRYGISSYHLQNEINIALQGRQAGSVNMMGHQYPIVVSSSAKSIEDLNILGIRGLLSDDKIFLSDLYDLELGQSAPVIKKYNGQLSLSIYSDVVYGYSPVTIQDQLARRLDFIPDSIDIAYLGEKDKIEENFGDVGLSAVLALVLVYVILLIQFHSFLQPIVILVTIPLSTFGSVIGLTLSKQPLSFTAILGMVSLLGIVVNNAIVLVDYINHERRGGKPLVIACQDAVDKRFRPIILSTITTVIGLLPLVYSGGALFVPMAISLISGLLVSMFLTLLVIPSVYLLFVGQNDEIKKENTGKKQIKIRVNP